MTGWAVGLILPWGNMQVPQSRLPPWGAGPELSQGWDAQGTTGQLRSSGRWWTPHHNQPGTREMALGAENRILGGKELKK